MRNKVREHHNSWDVHLIKCFIFHFVSIFFFHVTNIHSKIELKLNFLLIPSLTECATMWRNFPSPRAKIAQTPHKFSMFLCSLPSCISLVLNTQLRASFFFFFLAAKSRWRCPGECESSESSIEFVRFRNHITILTPKAVARF